MKKIKGIVWLLILAMAFNMLGAGAVLASEAEDSVYMYEPYNPLGIEAWGDGSDAGVRYSWINPTSSTLEKVSAYDSDGYGIYTNSSPVSGAAEEFVMDEMTQGAYYTVKLVFSFSDRKDTVTYVSGRAYHGWFNRTLTSGIYTTGCSGSVSAPYLQKVVTDGEDTWFNLNSNVKGEGAEQLKIDMAWATTAGKPYELKVKYRAEKNVTFGVYVSSSAEAAGSITFVGTSGWSEKSVFFTPSVTSTRITLIATNTFKNLDIMEMSLEQGGAKVSSFNCGIVNTLPRTPERVTLTPEDDKVTITVKNSPDWWYNSGSDGQNHTFVFYNIYEVIDGVQVLRARLVRPKIETDNLSVTLEGLEEATHYTYRVTVMDDIGLESPYTEASFDTPDPYGFSGAEAKAYRISAYQVGMEVKWNNPSSDTLTGVKLYRTGTDGDTLIKEYSDASAGAAVTYKDANLETNKAYSYKLVASFSDKDDVSCTVSGLLDLEIKELVVDYNPKNMTAVQYGSSSGTVGATLSWINPSTLSLTGISVYRVEDDGETLLSTDFDLAPENLVEYSDLGIEKGFYTYKITFSYSDTQSRDYYMSVNAKDDNFSNWLRGVNTVGIQSIGTRVVGVINNIVTDGDNNYLHLAVNVPESDKSSRGAMLLINPPEDIYASKSYTFSFKMRTEEDTDVTFKSINKTQSGETKTVESGGWRNVSFDFSPSSNTRVIMLCFNGSVLGADIDDILLTCGGNTVDSLNFDEGYKFPAVPGAMEITPSGNSAAVNVSTSTDWWWNDQTAADKLARTINYYNVYEVTEEGRVLRMRLARPVIETSSMSGVLNDLLYSTRYTLEATCSDLYGVIESPSISAAFKTGDEPTGTVISDFSVKSASGGAGASVGAGTYSASVSIGSYGGAGMKAQLIAAVYSGNKLVKAYSSGAVSVPSSAGNKPKTELTVENIVVPSGMPEGSTLEIMLWSGVDTMKILKSVKVIEVK